jgi:hypothetical protein
MCSLLVFQYLRHEMPSAGVWLSSNQLIAYKRYIAGYFSDLKAVSGSEKALLEALT